MYPLIILLSLLQFLQACPSNCAACNDLFCLACAPNYELNIDGQCISAVIIPHCSVYLTNTTCTACYPTYLLDSQRNCVKDYTGCVHYDEFSGVCTQCLFGKYIINGVCRGVLNCANYDNDECQKCKEGFILKNSVCYWVGGGCQTLDPGSGSCSICEQDFELVGFSCVAQANKVPNCYLSVDNSTCVACKSGFINNTAGECVLPPNDSCFEFDVYSKCIKCGDRRLVVRNGSCVDANCVIGSLGDCKQCVAGYVVRNQSLCEFYDSKCITYNPTLPQCDQCAKGYFTNSNGSCSLIPPNCLLADVLTLTCINCSPNYVLSKGVCVKPTIISNCKLMGPTKTDCSVCKQGYFASAGTCKMVSPLCNGYDPITGVCIGCKGGYINYGGQCVDPNCQTQNADICTLCKPNFVKQPNGLCYFYDPNCQQANILSCLTCKSGYYNKYGLCNKLPANCLAVSNDGSCSRCGEGYQLNVGACIVPIKYCKVYQNNGALCDSCELGFNLVNNQCELMPSSDANCISFKNGVCVLCSNRFYYSGKCLPVNPNCKSYSLTNGSCTDCYAGYILAKSNCQPAPPKDPFCKTVVPAGCSQCYQSYFLENNTCFPLNALCKTANSKGECLTCYSGYSLRAGVCTTTQSDPNCIRYSQDGTCLTCSDKYYQRGGLCTRVSPLCKTYNVINGSCLTCYPGYYLAGGACWAGNDPNLDPNCNLRSINGSCLQCSGGYYLSSNGYCKSLNPLCKTFNQTNGACLSCYQGYIIQNQTCILGNGNADPHCLKFLPSGGCQQCYSGFYVSANLCKQINQFCKTTNFSDGLCLTCYPGYSLYQGNCVIPNNYNAQAQNPYCVAFSNSLCTQCQSGYYVYNGTCNLIDPQCQNFDKSQGRCISCYLGYELSDSRCMVSAQSVIPFCQTLSPDGRNCRICMQGYYTSTPNTCNPVSILCFTYDANTGACTSCRNGYFFQNGQCIYPSMGFDANCISYDVSAYCSSCKPGFYLLNYICTKINPNCVEFDYSNSVCLRCGNALTASGSSCV